MAIKKRIRLLLAALSLSTVAGTASATDDYPNKPVRLVVSYAAGNITDVLGRIIAQRLSEQWKQPVLVENRPGQGGSTGAQQVVKAPADGYTLLFSAMAAMAINPHVYQRVGYDPNADFVPIVGVAYPNGLIYVGADVKANTLDELVRLSKSQPGILNYGSPGSGTVPHLNVEALKARTGLDATHVPYKAAVAVMTDVVGGRIHFAQESIGVVMPQIQSGRIRPVVALTPRRLPQLPDLPTIGEVLPGFESVTPWLGIFAPAGVPQSVVRKVHESVAQALREPEIVARINAAGMEVLNLPPAEFKRTVSQDVERLGVLVRKLDLKAD